MQVELFLLTKLTMFCLNLTHNMSIFERARARFIKGVVKNVQNKNHANDIYIVSSLWCIINDGKILVVLDHWHSVCHCLLKNLFVLFTASKFAIDISVC
jgi:hypothetical protein